MAEKKRHTAEILPARCSGGYCPLPLGSDVCRHQRRQKWLPDHNSGMPYKKEQRFITADISSVTNHSILNEWPKIKVSELKRGYLHHKVAPHPQKQPGVANKHPKSSPKYHVALCQGTRQLLH